MKQVREAEAGAGVGVGVDLNCLTAQSFIKKKGGTPKNGVVWDPNVRYVSPIYAHFRGFPALVLCQNLGMYHLFTHTSGGFPALILYQMLGRKMKYSSKRLRLLPKLFRQSGFRPLIKQC